MTIKKGTYLSRSEFVKHVATIVLGRFLFDGTTEVPFSEVADYLSVSTDALRFRKKDAKSMALLEEHGIKARKIKGINTFVLEAETLLIIDEEEPEQDNTLII